MKTEQKTNQQEPDVKKITEAKEFTRHVPVLLQSVLEQLNLKKGGVYVDCNLGDGGHSEEIIKKLNGDVTIIAFDLDQDAIDRAKINLEKASLNLSNKPKIIFIHDNFRNLKNNLNELKVESADGVLYDLGLSSYELEESGRGFSFRKDEPLIMTFANGATKKDDQFTAYEIINEWDEENLRTIIEAYGEEDFAYKIAKRIVAERDIAPIKTSKQLAEIIKSAVPAWRRFAKTHPATKTFQALRIAINDELNALTQTLPQALDVLKRDGRLVVISYHSLEDRIVKNFFKQVQENGGVKILTKRPIVPTDDEIKENPRARSAKERVLEKIN